MSNIINEIPQSPDYSFEYVKDAETRTILKEAIRKSAYTDPRVALMPQFKVRNIVFNPEFNAKRSSDIWYRGWVASVEMDDYTFSIDAIGDQRYQLYVLDWDNFMKTYGNRAKWEDLKNYHEAYSKGMPILELNAKRDGGESFYDVFGHLFTSDDDLSGIINNQDHPAINLLCENNNWLEIIASSCEGRGYCLCDPFGGYDVGTDVMEELNFILTSVPELLEFTNDLAAKNHVAER